MRIVDTAFRLPHYCEREKNIMMVMMTSVLFCEFEAFLFCNVSVFAVLFAAIGHRMKVFSVEAHSPFHEVDPSYSGYL